MERRFYPGGVILECSSAATVERCCSAGLWRSSGERSIYCCSLPVYGCGQDKELVVAWGEGGYH